MSNYLRQATLNEIFKLLKHKTTYVYIIFVLMAIISSSFGIKFIEGTNNANNGYSFIIFSLQTLSTTILPFILLMFATNTISSEKASGTIRNILASGCSKNQFILSKLISSFVFLLILLIIAAIAAVIIGSMSFGFGNLGEDGLVSITPFQFWSLFITAYAILAIVLFAGISFGIMVSTITQTTISAIVVAISSYMVLEGIKTSLRIENFIYSSYIEFPLDRIGNMVEGFPTTWAPRIYTCLIVSTLWIIITSAVSLIALKKTEFK